MSYPSHHSRDSHPDPDPDKDMHTGTRLQLGARPCPAYLADLCAFVDGELDAPSLTRLVAHVGGCSGCHDYTENLRTLSALNRQSAQAAERALVGRVDPSGLFASITRHLVDDKRSALARLFYELGKAYVLAGNRGLSARRRQSVAVHGRTQPIRSTEARARRTLREAEQLGQAGGVPASSSSLLMRRSRELFTPSLRDDGALARGRQFLEEALALDEHLDEARLYLGFSHAVAGRPDRARLQFRKVCREARNPVHRLMAVQSLGRLHAEDGDYRRAIECYEEVVLAERAGQEPGLFPSFLNLAVNYAKVGRVHDAVARFVDLVDRFPERRAQVRELLTRKGTFQDLLERDHSLKQDLLAKAPALFAA